MIVLKPLEVRLSRVSSEVPGLIALAVIVSLWTLVAEDLTFFDEPSYMVTGFNGGFTDGAAYADMYGLIALLIKDPVNLYFAGRMVAAVLFVLAMWGAIRIHSSARFAWAVAAVVAVIPIAHVWPGVANPAAALILLCVSAIIRWPSARMLSLCAGALWIAAAARPELVYFAFAVTVWAVVWIVREAVRKGWRATVPMLVALVGSLFVMVGLVIFHGTPLDTSRSWVAFGQHYGARAHLPGEDPWYQWGQIVHRDFPGASSVLGAALATPSNFLNHVTANAAGAPARFLDFVSPDFPLDHPARLLASIMLIAFVGAVLAAIALNPKGLSRQFRSAIRLESIRAHAVPLVFVALALAFSVAPPLVIFPRDHYMLVLVGFAFLLGASIIWRGAGTSFRVWALVLPQTAMFTLFALLALLSIANRSADPAPLLSSVRSIEARGETLNFLAIPSELSVYTDRLTPVTREPRPGETISEYLDGSDIRAVLVTDQLRFGPWGATEGFDDFLRDPTKFGFHPVEPNSPVFVR